MRYVFGDHEVDTDQLRISHRGSPVPVQPQVFDVLVFLILNRDRVVSKEELLDAVWGDRFVSESALTSRIKTARRAVGDDGDRQSVIRTVHGRGYQFVAALEIGPDESVAVRSAAPVVAVPASSFVGRERDLSELSDLLLRRRLVTICGSGGVGKTRLALHLAASVSEHFADGVRLVELAAVDSLSDVVAHIAAELGVTDRRDAAMVDRLADALVGHHALVLLDNCEHVLSPVVGVVEALLGRASGLHVLATSRRPLGFSGEQLWRLAPLPLVADGGAGPDAETLFIDRMRCVVPGVRFDDGSRSLITSICRQLDGVPLLIEIAAARTRHVGLSELEASLDDPVVLTGRSKVERHRSPEALIRWTFDRCEPAEQDLLCAVSTFASWFGPDGAAAVAGAGDVRGTLWDLVDQSLVMADPGRGDSSYRLLEPVRAFARSELDRLGRRAHAASLHADYVLSVASRADEGLRGGGSPSAMRRLIGIVPDVLLAHRTFVDAGRISELGPLLAPLFFVVQEQMRGDVIGLLELAVEVQRRSGDRGTGPDPVVLAACAVGAWQRGQLDHAVVMASEAVDESLDDGCNRFAHLALGQALELRGDMNGSRRHAQAAVVAAEAAGDRLVQVMALAMCAIASLHSGRVGDARAAANEARSVAGSSSSPLALAWATFAAGEIDLEAEPDRALPLLDAAVRLADEAGSPLLRGIALLSSVTLRSRLQPDADRVKLLVQFGQLIRHWELAGMWAHQWATLRNLVEFLARTGADADALRLHAAVTGSHAPVSAHGVEAERLQRAVSVSRGRVGTEIAAEAVAAGALMSPAETVVWAMDSVTRAGLPASLPRPTRRLSDEVQLPRMSPLSDGQRGRG